MNKQFRDDLKNVQRMDCLCEIEDGNAYLETLYWLKEKNELTEETISKEIESVSARGFTNVLKWVDENYGSLFEEKSLMDYAAKGGHIDTLEWLNENKPMCMSEEILLCAVLSNKLDVIEWVLDKKEEVVLTPSDLFYDTRITVEIVECILKRRPSWMSQEFVLDAACNCHFEVLKWLYDNYDNCVLSEEDLICLGELAVNKEIVEFVYERHFRGNVRVVGRLLEAVQNEIDDVDLYNWTYKTYNNEREVELNKREKQIRKKEKKLMYRE